MWWCLRVQSCPPSVPTLTGKQFPCPWIASTFPSIGYPDEGRGFEFLFFFFFFFPWASASQHVEWKKLSAVPYRKTVTYVPSSRPLSSSPACFSVLLIGLFIVYRSNVDTFPPVDDVFQPGRLILSSLFHVTCWRVTRVGISKWFLRSDFITPAYKMLFMLLTWLYVFLNPQGNHTLVVWWLISHHFLWEQSDSDT